MSLVEAIAVAVIVLAGSYLLALGVASLVIPTRASQFLLRFASSQSVHFAELSLRLLVGASLLLIAPRMVLADAFAFFGWALLVSSICLFVMPWRWHQRFAQHAVPRAIRYIRLIGLASLAIGGLIFAEAGRVVGA